MRIRTSYPIIQKNYQVYLEPLHSFPKRIYKVHEKQPGCLELATRFLQRITRFIWNTTKGFAKRIYRVHEQQLPGCLELATGLPKELPCLWGAWSSYQISPKELPCSLEIGAYEIPQMNYQVYEKHLQGYLCRS